MSFNKVKDIKRRSRDEEGLHGRSEAHVLKPHKQKYKKHARDYLTSYEEDEVDEQTLDEQLYLHHCREEEEDEETLEARTPYIPRH